MGRISLYRSLPIGLAAAALLFSTGCDDMNKSHQTLRQEQTSKWELTRLAVIYQLAQQQYEVGDYDKCKKTLADALALKTKFAPIETLAGKVEIEKGSLEAAADYLKEAARLDTKDPEPLYLLGVVYQRWQKIEVAEDYYQQAWDRKPSEPLYMLAVVEMKITLGQLDDAQKILQDKLVYFEQSAAVRIGLARIAALKNDHVTACRYYRDASILLPDDQKVRRSYAEELFYAKRYSDAAAIFEDMRNDPKAPDRDNLLLMLAQSYLYMRRPFDARNCLQELVRDNPNLTIAYLTLGEACVQTGDLTIAYASAQKVLRMEPDNEKAMILTAVVEQKRRRWAQAAAILQRAEKLAPTDTTVLCMLGIGAQAQGNKDEAIHYFEKAVQTNPSDTWATELLARAKPGAGASVVPQLPEDGPAKPTRLATETPMSDRIVESKAQ